MDFKLTSLGLYVMHNTISDAFSHLVPYISICIVYIILYYFCTTSPCVVLFNFCIKTCSFHLLYPDKQCLIQV